MREVIEADLAKATTELAKAIANNAESEAHLSRAMAGPPTLVSSFVKASSDVAKANVDLSKIRDHCRAARTALAKLNLAEGKPVDYGRKAHEDRRRNLGATVVWAHANRRKAVADRRIARRAADLRGTKAISESKGWADRLIAGAAIRPNHGPAASHLARDPILHSAKSSGQLVRAMDNPAVKQPRSRNGTRQFISYFVAQAAAFADQTSVRLLVRPSIQLLALVLAYLQYYLLDTYLQIEKLPSVAVVLLSTLA